MSRHTRRAVLRTFGPLVAGGLAGCTSRFTAFGGTPDEWPRRSTDEDDPVRWRLKYDEKASHNAILSDDEIVVTWSGELGPAWISKVTAAAGRVDWHREVSFPPYRPPVVHGNDVYLLTGVRAGHVRDEQQLRKFGPDGTEHWQTEPKMGLLDLHGIGDGRAYLGTTTRNLTTDSTDFPLYATSLADGSRDWTRETAPNPRGYYHDGRLIVEFPHDATTCFDAASGTEQWRADGELMTDQHRRPALASEVAYVERRDGIAAIDLRDGTELWAATPGDGTWGAAVSEGTVVVSDLGDFVSEVDPADGTERWRFEIAGSNPLLAEGTVFLSDEQYIYAVDAETGQRQWRIESTASIVDYGRGMLVTVDDAGESEEIVALDASDGTERWRYETPSAGGVTVGEWHTYAIVDDGDLVALGTR